MQTIHKAEIGLATRRFLVERMGQGDLDEATLALVHRALEKTRKTGFCAWSARLSLALGAPRDLAVAAGSFCELAHTFTDVADDVEDGDAATYLPDLSPALRIHLPLQLVTLIGIGAARLEELAGSDSPGAFGAAVFRSLCRAGCGQRLDLARDNWSVPAYVRMTELNGGCQFEVYVRAAALAARHDPEPLIPVLKPAAVLLQMACDQASADKRLLQLPASAIEEARQTAGCALAQAMEALTTRVAADARLVMQELADAHMTPPQPLER